MSNKKKDKVRLVEVLLSSAVCGLLNEMIHETSEADWAAYGVRRTSMEVPWPKAMEKKLDGLEERLISMGFGAISPNIRDQIKQNLISYLLIGGLREVEKNADDINEQVERFCKEALELNDRLSQGS